MKVSLRLVKCRCLLRWPFRYIYALTGSDNQMYSVLIPQSIQNFGRTHREGQSLEIDFFDTVHGYQCEWAKSDLKDTHLIKHYIIFLDLKSKLGKGGGKKTAAVIESSAIEKSQRDVDGVNIIFGVQHIVEDPVESDSSILRRANCVHGVD